MAIYLEVPYSERIKAKQLGAKWSVGNRKWYVNDNKPLEPFLQWLSAEAIATQPESQQDKLIDMVLDAKAKYKPYKARGPKKPTNRSKHDTHHVVLIRSPENSYHAGKYHCKTCNCFIKWASNDEIANNLNYKKVRRDKLRSEREPSICTTTVVSSPLKSVLASIRKGL
jgi:Domain of unknown function (DUF5710)